MSEKVDQHTHCQICGKVIPISETLCSIECKEKFQNMVKKRKMFVYIMYAIIFFIVAIFFIQSMIY
jgi:predicted nucleic acid-binding Zn ribbon protein